METLSGICYAKTFLTEVIVKVSFVSPVPELYSTLPTDVARAALRSFPIDEPKPAVTQAITISKDDISSIKKEFIEWNFYGPNREKRLAISPEVILMVHNKYERFELFRDEFCQVTEPLFEALPQAQASRIGLRFINQVVTPGVDPLSWEEHIAPELLGILKYRIENAKPSRLFHTIENSFDGFNLRFQFGIFNPDYPAPICQRQFILDFDAYYRGLVDSRDIQKNMELFHTQIQVLYERSITQQLRDLMNA